MLGWVAVTNDFAIEAGILLLYNLSGSSPFLGYCLGFDEDYTKAGFKMLPVRKEKLPLSKH